MVRATPLTLEAALKYRPREYEVGVTPQDYLPLAPFSQTIALYDDELDETLSIVGITVSWPGVADIWMFNGPNMAKRRVKVVRAIYNFIRVSWDMLGLRRLQCYVLKDYPEHKRVVEGFGFTYEGESPQFTPRGETVLRYAMVR